ncbi:zf-HC2 domain-containing protein [Streptomyces sp. NPDC051907]|uniref:anti-sigma factor family protein n=1 Tax=Streptomyces sp. NPDC051907 TaxID=3155284 RepID=UPI00341B49DF
MDRHQRHRDVAAYALGVLEPADAFRFEEHLSDCVQCAVQLSDFTAVASALSEVAAVPGLIETRPSQRLLDRLTEQVAAVGRHGRRRRLRLVVAAAALIVALPAATAAVRSSSGGSPSRPNPSVAQRVEATDAATGVTVSAAVQDRAWGTAVSMRVSQLPGPGRCRLVAVGKDGIEHPVLTWAVPKGGFGMKGSPGHEAPLEVEGGTDLPSKDIGRWEVRTWDGKPLVALK